MRRMQDISGSQSGLPSRNPAAAGAAEQPREQSRRNVATRYRKLDPMRRPSAVGVPAHWRWMIAVYTAVLLGNTLVAWSFPPLAAALPIALAIVLVGIGALVRRPTNDARSPSWKTVLLIALNVVLPPMLMGYALGQWVFADVLPWQWGAASLLSMNGVGMSMLRGRPRPLIAVAAGPWIAGAIAEGSTHSIAAVAALCVVVGLVARRQVLLQREEDRHLHARERIRYRAEGILREYEDMGQGWFWETDRRGNLSYLSPSVAGALDQPVEQLMGRAFRELFMPEEEDREGGRTIAFHLTARSAFSDIAVRAATPAEERWWSVSGRPVYDNFGNFCGFRGAGSDLTEKRRSEQQAARLAQFDSLTGLANRAQMAETLEKILSAPLEQHRACSVMLLDLDRFKNVNDTLGHPAGDALLQQVAQRLERAVGELGQVGRLGGDEFQVIVAGRSALEPLEHLAREIIHSLSEPYSIDGQRVVIGASVGIASAPSDAHIAGQLVRNADLALYAAKDGGRGRHHFYSSNLHAAAEERSRLEQDLRDAIVNGNLELYYQPVVHAHSEVISGFEALLRWNHPQRGALSPAKFIPIAEDTGLINIIGEWAIRKACDDLAQWPREVRCAVNVSPLQFANPQLPSIITSALAQSGVEASRLELEITESVFLNDDSGTDRMFASLKQIGVRLALDDFGTGYSSLGYLKTAPFDKIKIDQSFVRGATQPGSRNGAIIASITSLAAALGMDTTAEGVETFDELDLVRRFGCSHIQGYIYSQPLSRTEALSRLAAGLRAYAHGPKSARAARQTLLRKVVIEHSGHYYHATLRNLSITGAQIEGLWNVPAGEIFNIALSETQVVTATARWSCGDKMGVEFATPLRRDESSAISVISADHRNDPPPLLKSA